MTRTAPRQLEDRHVGRRPVSNSRLSDSDARDSVTSTAAVGEWTARAVFAQPEAVLADSDVEEDDFEDFDEDDFDEDFDDDFEEEEDDFQYGEDDFVEEDEESS